MNGVWSKTGNTYGIEASALGLAPGQVPNGSILLPGTRDRIDVWGVRHANNDPTDVTYWHGSVGELNFEIYND